MKDNYMDGKSYIGGKMNSKACDLKGVTTINIVKSDGYMKIEIEGHNENSIVCAGISAIIQTCELGLKALAEGSETVILNESEK
jgi:uncharacterized protein YsxB (DUF464 family)